MLPDSLTTLLKALETAVDLESANALLENDSRTGASRDGEPYRARVKATVAGQAHDAFINPQIKDLVAAALDDSGNWEDPALRLLVERIKFVYDRGAALPTEFVRRKNEAESLSVAAWKRAKKEGNFPLFLPHLKTMVVVAQEQAVLLGASEDDPNSLYNALFQGYEPGLTIEELRPLADETASFLTDFLPKVQERQKGWTDSVLTGDFPIAQQKLLCRAAAETVGFNMNSGRLGEAAHPFTNTVHRGDVWIATWFKPTQLISLLPTLHEAGHGMFEQNRPEISYQANAPGNVVSMAIHESQSRLWENRVGRNSYFWMHFKPILNAFFPQFREVTAQTLMQALHLVKPGCIRVEADEVTYNLHIIIRTMLEGRLLSGELPAEDLPGEWNRLYKQFLGITPENDTKGCLQDVHWASGAFGYFLSYWLGNLAAAQLFAKFMREHPEWQEEFANGYFLPLRAWLENAVWAPGYTGTLNGVLKDATGEGLSLTHWMDSLKTDYLEA